jgi:hypothetical protein
VQSVKASAVRPRISILSESYDRYQRYDGLYRYRRHHPHAGSSLEFFFISSETTRLRIWVAHPSFFRFAYREARGTMTETAPCPLVGEIREPFVQFERHPSRHSGIEASLYAHTTK